MGTFCGSTRIAEEAIHSTQICAEFEELEAEDIVPDAINSKPRFKRAKTYEIEILRIPLAN